MKGLSKKALEKELRKRAASIAATTAKPFVLEEFCFDKQLAFIQDPARFKTAVCSRRSGKSTACVADMLHTALTMPGDVLYLTLNRRSAKRIVWRELLRINKEYGLGGKPDNTELTLTMPNKNIIHLSGAKDESEIEKIRGMYFRKVYIDEAQAFRPYIKELIEDVIGPALTDFRGSLILIGTPSPLPVGYFFDVSTKNKSWSHHHWTMIDNPHLKRKSGVDPLDTIKEEAAMRGLSLDSPSILREYFGQWVKDADSLVYHFNPEKNIYRTALPKDLRYIFGVDIGYRDSDAIAVLGYSSSERKVFLVHEYVKNKQDITSLVEEIKRLKELYDPVKIVMDAGALGKKIQEEIRLRHALHTDAAEKARKAEFITLLNDDLRTGKLQMAPNSRFEEDSYLLQWDHENGAVSKVSTAYHSDIADAVLYAWRECRHFYEQDVKVVGPARNTDAYVDALEAKEAEEMELKRLGQNDHTDVNTWEDLGIDENDVYDDFN